MAHILRDKVFGSSRRHQHQPTQTTMPVYPIEDLPSPFGDLGLNISDSELRETAYEILVAACRSSGGKPLTYIPQSEKTDRAAALSPSSSLQRSLTSTAASRVKKALGLKPSSNSKKINGSDSVSQGRTKRSVTVGEMMRTQMSVSEQTDTRIRRGLLRVAAGQVCELSSGVLVEF